MGWQVSPDGGMVKGKATLLEEIVEHSELNTDMVLAAIRDHGFAAYDVLVKEFPSESVVAEFTKAARSGLTTFGVGVHLASLTDKGRKRLDSLG
ncbi:hypothetical protein [Nonomuraea gerenzanensis]|uniref:Uncharacterized protein n=1 Tax=Nonomuraea gerenzanensis TaxID=93944 RepID=A0A1M4EMB1_9ACTN|nr:hypothetical protein [Nonomuraea gerenzanensis]UBU11495.1 hypothetical protein LCN96_45460 [Nonomuraea gerenzanensis]SBO99982.1 hypothetical protein BN4615_P9498 [Nonomuraea gerenzanensis]